MAAQVEILTPFFDVGDEWVRAANFDGMANQGFAGTNGGAFAPLALPHQIATDTTVGGPPSMGERGNAQDSYSFTTRWHLNGMAANTLGSGSGGGANNIASITTTMTTGGTLGGYTEPRNTKDLYYLAVVYENRSTTTSSISGVTDNIGGIWTKHWSGTVVANGMVTQDGVHTLNVTLCMEVWARTGTVVSPQTSISVVATFASDVDSTVSLLWAFSGSPYPAAPFDADAPYTANNTIAANGNGTPEITGVSTASSSPLVFGIVATIQGYGAGGGPTKINTGTFDSGDFTDGGFGHSPAYFSEIDSDHSGVSGYLTTILGFFTQVSGQLTNYTVPCDTMTAGTGSPAAWLMYVDALKR
jgi:hypothetical protein